MPRSTIATLDDLDYPDSDGLPVAESEFQFNPLVYAVGALRNHFQDREDVYVVGDLLLYYEADNPSAAVAPDVFVVFGVPNHVRRTYLLWREGKAPDWVLEVTSRSTRQVDQGRKRELYARLGVSEYWQYDPTGDYLAPPLQGLVLSGGRYGAAIALDWADGVWSAYSPVLDLNLRLDEGVLRFHDPRRDEYLLTHLEENRARQMEAQARLTEAAARRAEVRARREAEARLQESEQARQAAEDRVAELEARLRALQQAPPGQPD